MAVGSKFKADVIVIAGTIDAREIIKEFCNLGMKVAATVTTKLGEDLVEEHANVETFKRVLTAEGMVRVIKQHDAHLVVDASHPYAVEASLNAMSACKTAEVHYIRYERENTPISDPNITRVKNYKEAALVLSGMEGNILLTIGSRNLEPFIKNIPKFEERVFVRVLPDSGVLAKCEKLGINATKIIAMKGPFSEELNAELIKYCDAKIMVTKDSGEVGGTVEKITAALNMGLKVIVVNRPQVGYTDQAKTIGELLFKVGMIIEEDK